MIITMIIFRLGAETIILITNECIVINDYDEKASGTPTAFLWRSSMPRPMFSLSWSPERSSSEHRHLNTPNHNRFKIADMVIAIIIIIGIVQVKTQIAGVTVIADINGFSWKHIRNLGIDQIRWGLHLSVDKVATILDFLSSNIVLFVTSLLPSRCIAAFLTGGFPLWFRRIHVVNYPRWPFIFDQKPPKKVHKLSYDWKSSKVTFHMIGQNTDFQDLQHSFQHDGSLPQWAYSEQHHLPWVGIDTNLIWTMAHESWCLSLDLHSTYIHSDCGGIFRSDLSDLHKEVAPEILPKDLGWDCADQDCCGEPD